MSLHRSRLPMTLGGLAFAVLVGCGGGGGGGGDGAGGDGRGTPTPPPSEPSFEELVHLFDYDQEAPVDLHYVATTTQADAEVHDVYYPDNLAPSPRLDGIHYIGHAAPSALLFQFGAMDPNISEAVAMEFYDAASEPKFIEWYDTGHGLNEQARVDRADWLAAQLAPDPAR